MKKLLLILILQTAMIFALQAQPVSDYSYKLDNGITVKTERCWNQVWVQQSYAPANASDKTPLAVNIRTLGDLISGSAFHLLSAGKEIRLLDATPGTYNLQLNFKLSGKPGTLTFVVKDVIIKAKTKTTVSVTLYDYQILIAESSATLEGLSSYETLINRYKGNNIQDMYFGIPTFYAKGQRDKSISPEQIILKTTGRIKPATYDMLISIGISGQTQKVWLENFLMKPDVSYKITINLNAGGITYTGGNKDVNVMSLYPAGTAAKQTGNPAPNKSLEIINYPNAAVANCCSPGTYDILLSFKNGARYEWRKSIVIQTGSKTEVK
jgi:hypothetical protein